jgi:hypothetical protein
MFDDSQEGYAYHAREPEQTTLHSPSVAKSSLSPTSDEDTTGSLVKERIAPLHEGTSASCFPETSLPAESQREPKQVYVRCIKLVAGGLL